MKNINRNLSILKFILRVSAIIEVVYFTMSQWFFHEYFFNSLGVYGNELRSTFVISQIQLIGAETLGIAMLTWIAAGDPLKYRAIIQALLFTGCIVIAIFLYNVVTARVPAQFIVNAILIGSQVLIVAILYPWNEKIKVR